MTRALAAFSSSDLAIVGIVLDSGGGDLLAVRRRGVSDRLLIVKVKRMIQVINQLTHRLISKSFDHLLGRNLDYQGSAAALNRLIDRDRQGSCPTMMLKSFSWFGSVWVQVRCKPTVVVEELIQMEGSLCVKPSLQSLALPLGAPPTPPSPHANHSLHALQSESEASFLPSKLFTAVSFIEKEREMLAMRETFKWRVYKRGD